MQTTPVLLCYRCGRPVVVKDLHTTRADPSGELLGRLMQGLRKIALCNFHQRQRNHYASLGRIEDWERGLP